VNRQIYEEASEWLVELRVGELDGAARERLDAWLRASPENIRAFLELSNIWEEGKVPDLDRRHSSEELAALARASTNVVELNRVSPEAPTVLEQVKAQLAEQPVAGDASSGVAPQPSSHLSSFRLSTRRRKFLAAASLAAIAVGAGGVAIYSVRNPIYTTGIAEQRTVQLPDGSTVELNARSRLRVRFTDRERDVDLLAGQALFKVAKNPARPFVVTSDVARVRAVGTQFDVNRQGSGTTITVLEGRVAVLPASNEATGAGAVAAVARGAAPQSDILNPKLSSTVQPPTSFPVTPPSEGSGTTSTEGPGRPDGAQPAAGDSPSPGSAEVFVSAGEQVIASPSQVTKPARADVAAATAWTRRELVFDATPLTDVVAEFNRYNTEPLVVSDPSLKDFHVTGVFSSTNPSSLVKFLKAQKGIKVRETDEAIRISKQ
jgi:transmembrane sensor